MFLWELKLAKNDLKATQSSARYNYRKRYNCCFSTFAASFDSRVRPFRTKIDLLHAIQGLQYPPFLKKGAQLSIWQTIEARAGWFWITLKLMLLLCGKLLARLYSFLKIHLDASFLRRFHRTLHSIVRLQICNSTKISWESAIKL